MIILGIDEVGRGCWAGPMVAGAVILGVKIDGLKDSKQLSKKARTVLAAQIQASATAFGIGWVSAEEIDKVGLTEANRLAVVRALDEISIPYDEIIIDGSVNFLADNKLAKAVIKADQTIPAVSAASIIAKVARDEYMSLMDQKYPGYQFADHVGYGTASHSQALDRLGICPLHRLSFKPVAKLARS